MLRVTEIDNVNNNRLIYVGQSSGFDSDQVKNIPIQYYLSLDSLPLTNLSIGLQAFVEENKKHYVSNGSGWYNTEYGISNAPYWDSDTLSTYEITDSATPLIVIAKPQDSDNPNLINQSFGSDSAQYMATISNDSSVFTFTPKSKSEIAAAVSAGNLTDSDGDFVYTFKWSDGTNFVAKEVTITYNTAPITATAWGGARYVMNIGYTRSDYNGNGSNYNAVVNDMNYGNIATPANAQDFGNLSRAKDDLTANISNGTRGIFWGGNRDTYNWWGDRNIDMITPATLGNTTLFGYVNYYTTLSGPTRHYTNYNAAGTSDGIYGLQMGGYSAVAGSRSVIEYITIDTQSNATNFGSTGINGGDNSAWNDATRSVLYVGSNNAYYSSWIKYLTTQTTGSATGISNTHDHGTGHGSCSDSTRGVTSGGNGTPTTHITYNVTQNLTDAIDFGNMAVATKGGPSAACDGVYAVIFAPGATSTTNTMEYVTVQTISNAQSFGDLLFKSQRGAALSGNAS